MTNAVGLSFANTLYNLSEYMKQNWRWPSPETGFAIHVFQAANENLPLSVDQSKLVLDEHRFDQAPILATAGYLLSKRDSTVSGIPQGAWVSGLERLSSRDAFPADHATFAFRPLEVLGIALGAISCPTVKPESLAWLRMVFTQLEHHGVNSPWSAAIYSCAASVLGVNWQVSSEFNSQRLTIEELALFCWISVAYKGLASIGIKEMDDALVRTCINTPVFPQDISRAAVLHHSIHRVVNERIESYLGETWQINRESRDGLRIVENLCRRFPLFAKQLLDRHGGRPTTLIRDEYDLQDIMHAVLQLHFDDIRTEEWTPSYAGNSSRMDFLLKREKIVVETKMTRKNLDQKAVANQLGEDKERYRTHPDCQTLVCFVYDPECRCHNPIALEDDVSVSHGDFRVVVIVSPRGT